MAQSLIVNVEDEQTYLAAGFPLVQDAIGKLVDQVTGLTVETAQTSSGTLDFFWWTSGYYDLYVASADHEMFTGIAKISISSGTTTINAFLKMAAVSYTFAITPTDPNTVVLDGHGLNIFSPDTGVLDLRFADVTINVPGIEGLATADTIYGSHDDDVIRGMAGADELWGGRGDDKIYGGIGFDEIHGGGNRDTLLGGTGMDTIFGDDGKDVIKGQDGRDQLHGGDGKDKVIGGDGKDKVFGDDGEDVLKGGKGKDFLDGGRGSDKLYGGKGDDIIFAGNGLHSDVMIGGAGADQFVFAESFMGNDRIKDFEDGIDLINFTTFGPTIAALMPLLVITTVTPGTVEIDSPHFIGTLTVQDKAGVLVASDFTIDDFILGDFVPL